jgi:hypothetical protein
MQPCPGGGTGWLSNERNGPNGLAQFWQLSSRTQPHLTCRLKHCGEPQQKAASPQSSPTCNLCLLEEPEAAGQKPSVLRDEKNCRAANREYLVCPATFVFGTLLICRPFTDRSRSSSSFSTSRRYLDQRANIYGSNLDQTFPDNKSNCTTLSLATDTRSWNRCKCLFERQVTVLARRTFSAVTMIII